jgi:hypothetical protein
MLALATAATAACSAGPEDDVGEPISDSESAVAPPCATPLAEVDGVWAYSNGTCQGSGACSCAGSSPSGALRYQCVELVQRYFHDVFGFAELWPVANASQMCDPGRHPAGTTVHWLGDGYVPRRGDAAVWTGDGNHAAIVVSSFEGGIEVVEQNASAAGRRTFWGDSHSGYFASYGTTPRCFVTAGGSGGGAPAAECDALGYAGGCYGEVAVWSDGECRVRDCAVENTTCGWMSDEVGFGCLGAAAGQNTFDCAAVGYDGVCLGDTLVWAEDSSCRVFHCPSDGRRCDWDGESGHNCVF